MTPAEIHLGLGPSVANIVVLRQGQRLSSGSGFLVNGKLVTCGHVVRNIPANCTVEVRFWQTPTWILPAPLQLAGFSDEASYDYAIFAPPHGVQVGPSLTFATDEAEPGEQVCSLGYPFEDPHLTIHQGIVSAVFDSGPARMVKLDMSVNPSNSGGPVIRQETGEVLGVVARKATGLTRAFDELMESFDGNIAALRPALGGMRLGGLDPFEALLATQHQMRQVSLEIQRSSNVGIGYAIWCDPLRDEPALTV
ncbi:serine protease [Phenylobacterium sp.]|uniref:S1 family peptidase n=1 Tax=Phenylobacterium sp. TaxID=1871053 RepID=UPI00286D6BDC|nr:serine protease [Phenylobacterium sp.]